MSDYIDQKEREYQNEIVKLFCDELKYDYLGKLQYAKSKTTLDNGEKNSPIIDSEVRRFLSSPSNHYTDFQIEEALRILKEETRLPDKKRGILSDTSNSVYERLITHIAIQPDAEHKHENVTLFDFDNPFPITLP